MAEIYLQRIGKTLLPADLESEKLLEHMPQKKIMRVKYNFIRNAAFHRKGFALLQTLFDIQEHFDQFEPFRKWLVAKAGFFKTYTAPNGYVFFEAESLAWGSMDDARFAKVYNAVIDTFLKEFPHITKADLERVLEYAE